MLINDHTLFIVDEPAYYKEVIAGSEASKRKTSMESKIQFMYDNQVWDLMIPHMH